MDFAKYLNYSLGNEDWLVEAQALQVQNGDHVICVTASGDRALHLLMTDCAEILSIDSNQIQNYLLELKLQAINHLDYEAYLCLMGLNNSKHRYALYQKIKPHLKPNTQQYWDNNKKMLERGIAYQGRVERLTRTASIFFKLMMGKKIKTLLSFDDLTAQQQFVKQYWDTLFLRKIFNFSLNPKVSQLILNDPGLNVYLGYENPGSYIYKKMLAYLHNDLASRSALLQLIFLGRILPPAYFEYLTFAGYSKIRENSSRLTWLTDNVITHLEKTDANSIDAFSLSDIASYMPQPAFEKLLLAIKHAGKQGARFCLREFMSNRYIPTDLQPYFKRNKVLETKLEREESNFVYRFMAGELQK